MLLLRVSCEEQGTTMKAGSGVPVWVACLLLTFPAIATETQITQPEVDTPLGCVRGRQVGVKGIDHLVNVFLGIPFAQPPLGPLRFSAPLPAQPWEGVRDASTDPPMCMQDIERMNNSRFSLNGKHQIFSISEDCLVLNIYSPAKATTKARKPVMVWIHGGSLMVGSATSQDGSALAAYEDVVVVTVQYRLGILGFFSTGDKRMPSNQGFLDVIAALRWVQENIAPFGGDPNCVTIFGGSAGACIVSALVLSPMATGLFHRAIAQSGVIFSPMLTVSDSSLKVQSLAESLACSSDSMAELVQCLQQKKGEELILTKESKMIAPTYTIDGSFFPKSPEELLKERQFHPVPFLVGVNNHEFGWLIPRAFGLLDKMEQMSRENMLDTLKPSLTNMNVPPEMTSMVIDQYLGSGSDAQAIREAFQELAGDIIFNIPTLNFSRNLQDSGVPIFFYEFQHVPSSFAKIKPPWVKADHAAEQAFMFGGPFLMDERTLLAFPEATEEEKQLSLTMMAQWARFAQTGDPNGKGLPFWPQFNQLEQYLEISLVPRIGQKLKEAQMQFWTETLPSKIQQWHQKKQGRKAPEEL
ncbi:PREDICTED: carboxylesterase 3 [Chinchilla lanigera]|uniref:carboxylesterase 3 n=1 Tax=Chinchilla lanigera TaxID=34839 RepID=UPI00038F0A65|nr:PREDICTED: carboxylesterase 3 [Chinchilla lanigera]